jgi:hypothetical protein
MTLKMEAVQPSEISANFYWITMRYPQHIYCLQFLNSNAEHTCMAHKITGFLGLFHRPVF